DRERQVLMNSGVRPPNPPRVGVGARVGLHACLPPQREALALACERHRRHHLLLAVFVELPAPHVVAASDDAGVDPLRDPRLDDEVADLGFDANELARANPEPRRVSWMDPERVRVRDLVEPLGIGAPRMDLYG